MHLQATLTALLAVLPIVAQAQVCTIRPAGCTIGTQPCPSGCFKSARCFSTSTATRTSILPASTSTKTSTITQPATTITRPTTTVRVTVTATKSTSTSAAPACATGTPYVNLFTFPDTECKNSTELLGLPLAVEGLSGSPIKLNTLTFLSTAHPNTSRCALFDGDGAQSVYYTIDGIPENGPQPDCFVNLFSSTDCSGAAETWYGRGGQSTCLAADEGVVWRSGFFDCLYS